MLSTVLTLEFHENRNRIVILGPDQARIHPQPALNGLACRSVGADVGEEARRERWA